MKKAVILAAVLALSMPVSVCAQGFGTNLSQEAPAVSDRGFYNRVFALATENRDLVKAEAGNTLDMHITSVRGGADSGKPLGLYGTGSDVVFRSDYAKLGPADWATWTCALKTFIESKGGGYSNYTKYVGEQAVPDTHSTFGVDISHDNDPMYKSFVPYEKQEEFAKMWFSRHYPRFRKMGFVWKDWWVNDAILDGNNLIAREHIRSGAGADGVMYEDSNLARLLKKK